MSRRNINASLALTLAASLMMGAGYMPIDPAYDDEGQPVRGPKRKVKREPMPLTDDETLKLETLEQDRTSPGRKALKQFKRELNAKYRGAVNGSK